MKKFKTKNQRLDYQKKKGHKGIKSMRGKPELYDELKSTHSFCLTPTAKAGLQAMSQQQNISCSELIERIGRGIFFVIDASGENLYLQKSNEISASSEV